MRVRKKTLNEEHRHGFSRWATDDELQRARMFTRKPDSVFLGFYGRRPVYGQGQGPIGFFSRPRSGKFTLALAYNALGPDIHEGHALFLDMKGEIYCVARLQVSAAKHLYAWNPNGLHGIPSCRINPVAHLRADSPELVARAKAFVLSWYPLSGGGSARFFEISCQDVLEALSVTLADNTGVLTLPDLHYAVNLLGQITSDAWLEIEAMLATSRFAHIRRVGAQLALYRQDIAGGGDGNVGGLRGVITECFAAVSCLNDPQLRATLSPPFDLSFEELCQPGAHPTHLHLILLEDMVEAYNPVLRTMLEGLMSAKARQPFGPKMVAYLDEVAQLGHAPIVRKMLTLGAGLNLRPVLFLQAVAQLDKIDRISRDVLLGSMSTKIYMQVDDNNTARMISDALGTSTQEYDDIPAQQAAALKSKELAGKILALDSTEETHREYAHYAQLSNHRSKIARPLLTPSEVLGQPRGSMIGFIDGLDHPVKLQGIDYFLNPKLNGHWMPNPYHPPVDSVRLHGGFFGPRKHRVIKETVPPRYADWPQYRESGEWDFIDGFRPT